MSKLPIELDLDLLSEPSIIVYATQEQLSKLKKLVPTLNENGRVERIVGTVGMYKLRPKKIPRLIEKIRQPGKVTINELRNSAQQDEYLDDFVNSQEFYTSVRRNKKCSIIYDDFSNSRNAKLYGGFLLVETNWRTLIMQNSQLTELFKKRRPTIYRNDEIDHYLSCYPTSELMESIFEQPASREFVIQRWQQSTKADDELVKCTQLTMLDELDFPLKTEEIKRLINIRNQCMHFRITTPKDYDFAADVINRFLIIEGTNELTESLRNIDRIISRFFEENLADEWGYMYNHIFKIINHNSHSI